MALFTLSTGIVLLLIQSLSSQQIVDQAGRAMDFAVNIEVKEQALAISQLNVKLEELHSRIAEQDVKIAQQNTKLAEQDAIISKQSCDLEKLMNREKQENESTQKDEPIKIKDETTQNRGEVGAVFTRWGRRDCPVNITHTVYTGFAAGSWFDLTAGAADYICLPFDPVWGIHKHFNGAKHPQYMPSIYGTEYDDMPNPNLNQLTVPCTVCRTKQFSTMVMIPGRNICYPGWTEAYHGHLGTGPTHFKGASNYICLDDDPQYNGTSKNENGKLVYYVKTRCGSLPCPPYEDQKVLSCVVCLK